jgi:hypothetical protein
VKQNAQHIQNLAEENIKKKFYFRNSTEPFINICS